MDLSEIADNEAELYMFVYNMSEDTVYSDSYEAIFKGSSRAAHCDDNANACNTDKFASNVRPAAFEKNSSSPFPSLSCGLSLEKIKDAYNNLPKHSLERASSSNVTYNRAKNKAASKVGETNAFYIIYTNQRNDSEKIKPINATCVYVNGLCQVFVEDGYYDSAMTDCDYIEMPADGSYSSTEKTIKVTKRGVEKIAEKFEAIYGPETSLLGGVSLDEFKYSNIIETSEKITILISNLGLQSGGETTLGYFYPGDLYCDFDVTVNGNKIEDFSNQRLMFTLNTIGFSADYGADVIYSTLGHEFNHMINYINKVLKHNTQFDTWFTEMLSAITEDFTPDYLGIENTVKYKRLPYFNNYPYSGMIDWDATGNSLFAYGFAYAFGSYLVRNYGGTKIIYEMANNEFYGKDAINAALTSCGYDEKYDTVLQKFGLVMANADGTDAESPTLNKKISETFKGDTYYFPAIDLYDCGNESQINTDPYFYKIEDNYIYFPRQIYANGFYATYLGDAREWNYSLAFSPPSASSNIVAYIYIRN